MQASGGGLLGNGAAQGLGQRGCTPHGTPRALRPHVMGHNVISHVQENTSADAAPMKPKKGAVGSPSALEASSDREIPSMLLETVGF